ncbi:MAG: histidine triad nucleotide-binding protein [Bacteroidota bacterium]|nr:histidine triad nucleotide-binding protein [Bacteroidota bacterium]MDP4229528.1 histidine triad nucleotide-binding protein [Bacteroidota bacterium]MDP4236413.1 histidine triad nucleotide-binding protein [Bacteroidota bacterium]
MSIFEKIIAREIPATIIYQDDDVIAFNDIDPKAPVHIVIATIKPIPTLNDLAESDATLMGKMILVARHIAASEGIEKNGYRIVFNCNRDGGQSVFHIHCHLLGGRQMDWPPG